MHLSDESWPGAHVDDLGVASVETFYRRIASSGDANMLVYDETLGRYRASSGAFSLDDDGCSGYLRSILEMAGLSVIDVVRTPQNLVVSLGVREIRAASLGVRRDPFPDVPSPHPRDVAHALMVNCRGLGKRPLQKARSELARISQICLGYPNL